jgi:hypothetical protein
MEFTRFKACAASPDKSAIREYPAIPHLPHLRRQATVDAGQGSRPRFEAFGRVGEGDENLEPAGKRSVNLPGKSSSRSKKAQAANKNSVLTRVRSRPLSLSVFTRTAKRTSG